MHAPAGRGCRGRSAGRPRSPRVDDHTRTTVGPPDGHTPQPARSDTPPSASPSPTGRACPDEVPLGPAAFVDVRQTPSNWRPFGRAEHLIGSNYRLPGGAKRRQSEATE
ncbi:hypothetical protein MINT15_06900 [Saccharomonospora viridis]|uniref:Uncharacterized protein n=1 Tax=Saccharomonospora viridis TaxID=1852 RepID=A0A837DCA6_9PSEU|nr:hypothetical protein MINT15_06900 [Saccharomonospora viridis]